MVPIPFCFIPCCFSFTSCCCSVAKSCPTHCHPMDCSTPGFLVLHYLLEFSPTHVHWVGDAIQPFHPLSPPSPALSLLHLVSSKLALEDRKERNKLPTTQEIEWLFLPSRVFLPWLSPVMWSHSQLLFQFQRYFLLSSSLCFPNTMTLLDPLQSLVCSSLTFMRIALFMTWVT